MAIALSTLLALAVSVSAEPASLTLGKNASARIEVRVKGAVPGAKVTLSTNIGAVGEPTASGDGQFTAEYTPPSTPGRAWLSALMSGFST